MAWKEVAEAVWALNVLWLSTIWMVSIPTSLSLAKANDISSTSMATVGREGLDYDSVAGCRVLKWMASFSALLRITKWESYPWEHHDTQHFPWTSWALSEMMMESLHFMRSQENVARITMVHVPRRYVKSHHFIWLSKSTISNHRQTFNNPHPKPEFIVMNSLDLMTWSVKIPGRWRLKTQTVTPTNPKVAF